MSRRKAYKVRTLLRSIAASESNKRLTTHEMVATLRKGNKADIEKEQGDLVEMALLKIAADVVRGRISKVEPNQAEMFEEYKFPKRIPVPTLSEDGSKVSYVLSLEATFAEAKAYLATKNAPKTLAPADTELARAVDELRPFASSDHQKMFEAWEVKVQRG